MIIGLLNKPIRPQFISIKATQNKKRGQRDPDVARDLHFIDIVTAMLDQGHKSYEIIELTKILQNQIEMAKPKVSVMEDDGEPDLSIHDELDYSELFALFIMRRKIRLLRFIFSLDAKQFSFKYDYFLKALELEAYDMAALLYKEFFRFLRDMPSSALEQSITSVISSFNKNNGMLD